MRLLKEQLLENPQIESVGLTNTRIGEWFQQGYFQHGNFQWDGAAWY